MKVSNKIAAFILCIAVLFSLAACTGNTTDTSTVDSYKAAAQKFIDAGDTESAKKALEEGIALTQDESLKDMLNVIKSTEKAATAAEPEVKPQEQTPATAPATPQPQAPQQSQPTETPAASAKADNYYGLLSLPTPITCYTLSTGRVTTYYGDDLKGGTGYIDGAKDLCVIQKIVMINGICYAKVTYPGVKNYAYAPMSAFVNENMAPLQVTVYGKQPVARRSDEQQRDLGTVFSTDKVTAVSVDRTHGTVQIIYNVDGGGYKMGWIPILSLDTELMHEFD